MFGLGTWEIAIILILALLVLGPDKLPKVARTLGKGMREMRRAANDLRMNIELDDVEPRPVDPDPNAAPPSVPAHPDQNGAQIAGARIDAYDLSPNRGPIETAVSTQMGVSGSTRPDSDSGDPATPTGEEDGEAPS